MNSTFLSGVEITSFLRFRLDQNMSFDHVIFSCISRTFSMGYFIHGYVVITRLTPVTYDRV